MLCKTLDEYILDYPSATSAASKLGVSANTVFNNTGENGTGVVFADENCDTLFTQLNRFHRVSGAVVDVRSFSMEFKRLRNNRSRMAEIAKCQRNTISDLLDDPRRAIVVHFDNGEVRIMREVGL